MCEKTEDKITEDKKTEDKKTENISHGTGGGFTQPIGARGR